MNRDHHPQHFIYYCVPIHCHRTCINIMAMLWFLQVYSLPRICTLASRCLGMDCSGFQASCHNMNTCTDISGNTVLYQSNYIKEASPLLFSYIFNWGFFMNVNAIDCKANWKGHECILHSFWILLMILHHDHTSFFICKNLLHIVVYLPKARTVKPAETVVVREWLCKHACC
jgi:hypothetical protein